ncbi:MAG: OB-fold-containig protein [Sphingomonas sp.]|uniref:OB-fold-containig protein n=1 Tax=Sphingomonas sp. TaxID=28214 RepID=UPI003568D1D6
MFSIFLTPDYFPFAVAFVVMLGIGLVEAVGLGLGHLDLHPGIDGHAELDGHGVLEWLGLGGGLPLLIWLTSLLCCFTIAGVAVQQIATGATGAPLHWGVASAIALATGGLANIFAARGLARILPGYESSVIDAGDLLRRRGTILEGTARRGFPARARIVDQHDQAHYVMVEPHDDADTIAQGETVLLVRREGVIFYALPENHPTLRPLL